ncbi:barbed-end actin filament uncapping, partial [Bonamia ostreae]
SITTIFSSLTKNPDASKGAALNLNLDLSDCAFENTQQPLIPEPIRFITELNLSKCSFKSKQLEQFLVQLENLRCLHTLNLSRCGKNYQGKKTVGECLAVLCHSLPSLQFLSLGSFCDNAKKESLSAFLESLGQNRSILRLDLTGCKLTDEDFAKLGEAISKNNTLRILEFGENKASLKGFTRFLEILNKSENVIGKLPKKDVKQFLKGRGKEEDKLKLKLAADESDNRFDNNIKLVVGESVNK